MERIFGRTIAKFEENTTNEDSVRFEKGMVAVSDGAGGGGLYADRWSAYLLEHLPMRAIVKFEELDGWIDKIWEPFYNQYEAVAKEAGGMYLDKFYDEGSFATLAAAWRVKKHEWKWMCYGDSVLFHYRWDTHVLEHSYSRLVDFAEPPYLISCKDPLKRVGFRCGTFRTGDRSVVFVTSDALAHHIMMLYELSCGERYREELNEVKESHNKNSQLVRMGETLGMNQWKFEMMLKRLLFSAQKEKRYEKYLREMEDRKLLGHDDYSLAVAFCGKCWR